LKNPARQAGRQGHDRRDVYCSRILE